MRIRSLVSRWTILGVLVAATLFGVEHRLQNLPYAPPAMVAAASFSLAQ